MPDVKPSKRPYYSARRAAQAAVNRDKILSTAKRLFLAQGWSNTTIAAVASEAGLSSETVYASFGSKKAILQELVVRAVRDRDPKTSITDQTAAKRIAQETDQRQQIQLFASDITEVLERVAPLIDLVRAAADTSDEIARLYSQLHNGRRKNLEWFAAVLKQNRPLRDSMDVKAAANVLWRLASPELFVLVRRVEKVSKPAYATWLATTLVRVLLDDEVQSRQND